MSELLNTVTQSTLSRPKPSFTFTDKGQKSKLKRNVSNSNLNIDQLPDGYVDNEAEGILANTASQSTMSRPKPEFTFSDKGQKSKLERTRSSLGLTT